MDIGKLERNRTQQRLAGEEPDFRWDGSEVADPVRYLLTFDARSDPDMGGNESPAKEVTISSIEPLRSSRPLRQNLINVAVDAEHYLEYLS
jgi:hypothetical protein